MVEGEGFGPAQLGGLFTFIARQMSRQQGAIAVNRQLFDQVNFLIFFKTDESGIVYIFLLVIISRN